jgi:hypothetical protein
MARLAVGDTFIFHEHKVYAKINIINIIIINITQYVHRYNTNNIHCTRTFIPM